MPAIAESDDATDQASREVAFSCVPNVGWSPVVGLQLEYSLWQRTVEGELIPMAQELGLAVTPWSPLNNGVLTGKYTRHTPAHVATLDRLTEPTLDFPSQIVRTAFNRSHAGATVNGIPSTVMFPSLLDNEKARY